MIEKRFQDIAAKLQGGVAVPLERAKRTAIVVHAAVAPRTHHEIVHVIVAIFRLDGEVTVDRAPHVLLVPNSLQPHGGDFQRLSGHRFIECLFLPERIVCAVLGSLSPPGNLIEAAGFGEVTRGTRTEKIVVIFIAATDDG